MRRFKNVSPSAQRALSKQFRWLPRIHALRGAAGVSQLALCVFDHWLTEDEARVHLQHVAREVQAERAAMHAAFAGELARRFGALEFAMRGRAKDRPRFRSRSVAADRSSRLRQFVLPAADAACYEGYDETWHLYFTSRQRVDAVCAAARSVGLFVIDGSGKEGRGSEAP